MTEPQPPDVGPELPAEVATPSAATPPPPPAADRGDGDEPTELPTYTDGPRFMTTEQPEPPASAVTPWDPTAPRPPGPPVAAVTPAPPGGTPPGLPLYPAADPPGPRRHSPARLVAVAVAAFAFVAASGFAAYTLTRPDGADSPEAAVRQMFSAIDHEDALGVVESLPPGERKVLRDPLVDTTKELQRLGVLEKFSLNDVPGADLKVTGITTETTELGDGVVLVNVTGGTISGSAIPADIPLGEELRAEIEGDGGSVDEQPDTFSEDLADADLHLVAIEEGGGWHVSLAYSIAEAIRSSSEDEDGHVPPVPDFGHGVAPVGADSPEGAVKGLVDAAVAYDAERAIAMTDPEEMRALYDYAPLFLPAVARSAAEAKADGDVVVKVDRLDSEVSGDGPVRRVRITGFDITLGSDDDNVHMAFDGECYDITTTYRSYSSSFGFRSYDPETGEWTSEPSSGSSVDPEPEIDHEHVCAGDADADADGGSLFGGLGTFGSATEQPFAVTVTEVDGRWYVSPVRTILDSLVDGLRAMEPADFEDLGDLFLGLGSSSSEEFESVGEAVTDDPSSVDPNITVPSSGSGSGSTSSSSTSIPTTSTTTFGSDDIIGDVFPGLSEVTRLRVEIACQSEISEYLQAVGGAGELAFTSFRPLVSCAAGVVPGYQRCVGLIDDVVAQFQRDPRAPAMHEAVVAMTTCIDEVTG